MTELAVRQPAAALVVRDSPGDLITWANEARQAHEIAVQLADTSFVPKMMFRKPGEVTGAILTGRELGLSPMVSLRSIDIIDGTPAMRAHALRGLVQHHGHDTWVEDSTEHRAIVCGKRRGSEHIERSTWTMDRAKKAGLAGKKNWINHPTAMLVARATAEVCRLIAADVLLGMPYTTEELADDVDGPAPLPPRPGDDARLGRKAPRRTAQRAAAADPAEVEPPLPVGHDDAPPATTEAATPPPAEVEPALPDEPQPTPRKGWPEPEPAPVDAPVEPDPAEPMITSPQSRKLHAAFNDAGIKDRAARLIAASSIVGRDIESSRDLTKREARSVIDQIESGWPPVADPHDVVDAEVIDPESDPLADDDAHVWDDNYGGDDS